MYAYRVIATYPDLGEEPWVMIVLHSGNSSEVKQVVSRDGWKVTRVTIATADELNERASYEEMLQYVRQRAVEKRAEEAEAKRRAEIERHRKDEQSRQDQAAHSKAVAERRELAISKGTGNILVIDPEHGVLGNTKVASICAKARLFFGDGNHNSRDIFTSIGLDFADFQAAFDFPKTNVILSGLLRDLNDFLKIQHAIAHLNQQIWDDRVLMENKINSIASRTHIFGGSGDGLILSMLIADSGVRSDEREIKSLRAGHAGRAGRATHAIDQARIQAQLHEFRAKAAVSVLLVACGKADSIQIDMPDVLERHILGGLVI